MIETATTIATKTMKACGIAVRPLHDIDDMRLCVDLQRRIWGYAETDIVPDAMFAVAEHSGGQVLGAEHDGQLIGFALAYAARRSGVEYLHSHMVGVVPEYQDRGVGRLLKLAQREDAIARGINLIEWTFDPLQIKNAHFNLARLGAVIRHYIPNCYGRTSSPLHAGLPTDRLVAEWWIQSNRVERILGGEVPASRSPQSRVCVPADMRQICKDDPPRAEKIQAEVRQQFETGFAAGRIAVGFELDPQQGCYVLEPYED